MKFINVVKILALLSILFVSQCSENTSGEDPNIELIPPTLIEIENLSDQGASITWNSVSGAEEYVIELSFNETFENLVPDYSNITLSSVTLELGNLSETTDYYLRIRSKRGNELSEPSSIITFKTWLTVSSFSVSTDDNVNLHGSIRHPEGEGNFPVIIFCHSAGSDETEWFTLDLLNQFVENGYAIITFDVRSHGQSGNHPGASGSNILNDPDGIPKDITAIAGYIKNSLPMIDAGRIGVVGSSMGANLAIVGVGNPELGINIAVSLSPNVTNVESLSQNIPNFRLNNTFYLAAEDDGDREQSSSQLNSRTSGSKKIKIVDGGAHGSIILAEHDDALMEVLEWFNDHLKSP